MAEDPSNTTATTTEAMSQSFSRLRFRSPQSRNNRGGNPLADDDDDDGNDNSDDEYIEEAVEPGSPAGRGNGGPSGAYLSGVGDLSCSVTLVDYRRDAFSQMKHAEILEYVTDPGKALNKAAIGGDMDPDEEVEEVILDDDDVVVDEDEEECVTEVEYYEDSDIEEIELEDEDGYEEIVVLEGAQASSSLPPILDPLKASSTARSDDTAPTDDDDGDDKEDQDPPPSREEVAEAITYMVRQEKVVEYGLLTKQQVDEMNELPLEEMMEIMKHFEICDNNNATIQWDLVLAMINPDYAHLEDGDDSDGEPDAPKSPATATSASAAHACDGGHECGSHHDHPTAAADPSADTPAPTVPHDTSSVAFDDEGDVFTIQSDVNPFNLSHEAASIGSSYSLEVDQSEGGMSNLTYLDADNSDDEQFVVEGRGGGGGVVGSPSPAVSMDPRIRANYTKSMVELTKSHSFDE